MERVIARRDNILLFGTKPYEELGRYIASMDVCLIPLKMSGLRRAADPNKLYEYAACGKPIVTMAYSDEIRALSEMVFTAEDHDGFVAGVRRALEEGSDGERLMTFARSRSWQARADEMAALITARLGAEKRKDCA
jgi:glycosyltransferase involved in cell wall biosynthesis